MNLSSFFWNPFRSAMTASMLLVLAGSASAAPWWNKEWTVRQDFTLDVAAAGLPAGAPSGPVLVRLHEGNFQFTQAREDGSDLRVIAGDDKTPLAFHLERFDPLLNEAFLWVNVPAGKAGAPARFRLYYGNAAENLAPSGDSKSTYDPDTVLVYHFSETGAAPADASGAGNRAAGAGVAVSGSLIGGGLRFDGKSGLTIPASASLEWKENAAWSWSAWIKPAVLQANAVLFSRRGTDSAFLLGENEGVPFVEVSGPGGTRRSEPGAALAVNVWRHLAVVATPSAIQLYLDGELYSTLPGGLPALNTEAVLGRDGTSATGGAGFSGELDELQIARTARPAGFFKLAALNQSGTGKSAELLVSGSPEAAGHGAAGELMKHLSLFTEISKSLTFDGWIVIGLCTVLAVVGWAVTIAKFVYLNRIRKAGAVFMEQWEHLSSDLTALDHRDDESIRSMGGKANAHARRLMRESPLFHIYHLGSREISRRIADPRVPFAGLTGRSIQAIRVTLDGGLFREVQRLNSNIVFLTIGIAGGPYLGLLGTVIGVMITFAVIAQSGQVEINSIAPGIAGALLATVAGLAVAIPALFAYSYISSRIKDVVGEMQNFIEEFVAKIAEFYPAAKE